MRRLPIGVSDFRKLRRAGLAYVDKTALVVEVMTTGAEVLLFARPRRFGKTLNLSTLRCFLERSDEDATAWFDGLDVWRAGDELRAHFQRYPVIFVSFKDVKAASFDDCLAAVKLVIRAELERHADAVLPVVSAASRGSYQRLCDGSADRAAYERSLLTLSELLARAYGENVVILIDEYDTPIHAGLTHGYYEQAIRFFRNLLSAGLKDNVHLQRGVLSGILRLAQESVFSGLNNPAVYTVTSRRLPTAFGFTAEEVAALAEERDQSGCLADLDRWYNGYRFGDHLVYNPWSVLNYLDHPGDGLRPYWVAASDNALLKELLVQRGARIGGELESVLRGDLLRKSVDDEIVLRDIREQPEAVWGLLVHLGYLNAVRVPASDPSAGSTLYELAVPNREVRSTYTRLFREWLERSLGSRAAVDDLTDALLRGDAAAVERLLSKLLRELASYHDATESFFHGFVLGLLVDLHPRWEVRSNRESGYGRLDLSLAPSEADGPGVVIELKALTTGSSTSRDRVPEAALSRALEQARSEAYATELKARGTQPIHVFAVVFRGKRVWVRAATA